MPASVGATTVAGAGHEALREEFAARARPRVVLMAERIVESGTFDFLLIN